MSTPINYPVSPSSRFQTSFAWMRDVLYFSSAPSCFILFRFYDKHCGHFSNVIFVVVLLIPAFPPSFVFKHAPPQKRMYEVPVTYNTNSNTVSYNEPPMQGAYPTPGQYPGRIYGPLMPNVDPYQPREAQYISQDTPRDNLQQPLIPQQQQPPSPGRKSLFDYVSPFDALAPTTTGKKKTDMGYMSAESRDTEDSWATVPTSVDPKRKSVENLMDQLARSQAPVQTQQPSLDPYDIEPSPPPTELAQLPSKLPPPKQLQSQGSPHSSPALSAQRPHQVRSGDSPLQSASSKPTLVNTVPSVKERSGSPLAKSSWKAQDSKQRVPAPRKPLVNPKYVNYVFFSADELTNYDISTPSQNIVFDVAQSLESVQASRDYVRSTAIALVKVESTFLPGTTIGATHWVAYAMTRGKSKNSLYSHVLTFCFVQVVFESSADRAETVHSYSFLLCSEILYPSQIWLFMGTDWPV